ncbi:hypothetical protein [Mycobacterium sp. 23]|uniref:hypothetical protein n=1 Tax=Mycobacterium sp. 23 TaxID=3400424 RepID=UPI003AB00ED5
MPFDLGRGSVQIIVDLSIGKATYRPDNDEYVGAQAIPRKILFQSGGGPQPWLTMGIELVDGVPECTYLELDADEASPVRDKHLKLIRIEQWVNAIVAACARQVEHTPAPGRVRRTLAHGPATPQQMKSVERLQRRRRDPNDRALLERVAELYKANPDAPNVAISQALGMSTRTAGRWAARCSEVGLLSPVAKKGQKRL